MEEGIEKKLEKIKNNDVGISLKIYAYLIAIIGTIYLVYTFISQIIAIYSLENKVSLTTYFLLLGKNLLILFSILVVKDVLLMYYEIHFLIKHK